MITEGCHMNVLIFCVELLEKKNLPDLRHDLFFLLGMTSWYFKCEPENVGKFSMQCTCYLFHRFKMVSNVI